MALFKAPTWAKLKTDVPKDEEDQDLFSHSKSFQAIQEEQIKREKERTKRAKEKQEAKEQRRLKKRASEETDEKDDFKKRRITSEDGAKLLAKAGLGSVINLDSDSDEPTPVRQSDLPVRKSPRHQRTKDFPSPRKDSPRKDKSKLSSTVEIRERADEDVEVTAITSKPAPAAAEPDEEEESDPEMAEIKRNAIAKARMREQQQSKATPDAAKSPDADSTQLQPSPPQHDPPVQILITSPIPNTKPLIVYRKLSQALQPVKEAWVKRQELSDDVANSIFLTHCGRKLWSSTIVKRLGLEVDSIGRVYSVDDPSRQGVEKVAVEAVTPELFEQMKAEKLRHSKIAMGELEPEPEQTDVAPEEEETAAPQQIRLVVKAKDKPEWKVKVTPVTLVSKILRTAKRTFGIPAEQNAYLEFDGERLEPDDQVGNTELEDMYRIDLYLGS